MINHRHLLLALFSLSLIAMPTSGEEKKPSGPVARAIEVSVKVAGFPKTKATEPIVLKSKKEVEDQFADEATREAILKEVDFTKEQLLYFAWSGSGQDQLTFDEKKNDENQIVFRHRPGKTRDLRSHHRLFAMPSGGSYTVVSGFGR